MVVSASVMDVQAVFRVKAPRAVVHSLVFMPPPPQRVLIVELCAAAVCNNNWVMNKPAIYKASYIVI